MALSKLSTEGMVHEDNIVAWQGGLGLFFPMQETFKKPIQFECIKLKLLPFFFFFFFFWGGGGGILFI